MTGRLLVEPLQIPVAVAAAAVDVVAHFVADIVAVGCVGDELRWYRQPESHC